MFLQKNKSKGFTLIELLVVIAIIGILSSVVLASLNTARVKARDTKRKQDMLQIRTALEMYYNDNNSYPLENPSGNQWWGGKTTGTCNPGGSSDTYITGLVPTYISALPVDPSATGNCTGYLYNSDGTNYKLLIHASYEGTYPTVGQPWYDPVRPTWALMLCSGEPACSNNGANNAW